MAAQHLSSSIWALARLGHMPSEAWRAAFFAASARQLPASGSQVGAGARCRNGVPAAAARHQHQHPLASARSAPPRHAGKTCSQRPPRPPAPAQALSNTLWGCAKLALLPPRPWLEAFFRASLLRLPTSTSQCLSNTVWALGKLRVRPPQQWMAAFLEDAATKLPLFRCARCSGAAGAVRARRQAGRLPGRRAAARLQARTPAACSPGGQGER
jgi:hypothetical protein